MTVRSAGLGHPVKAGGVGGIGPAGPQGEPGPIGPQGQEGETGATGPAGPRGDTGQPGAKGDTGATGAQGPAGPKGDTGAAGAKGDRGDAGPIGPKGDTGASGAQGFAGAKGDKGDTGAAGPAGPQGPVGPAFNPGVIPVALLNITVANNVVTAVSLFGIQSVTRISAGRYRCTFSTPQPDTAYNPRSDVADANAKFSRINNNRTTAYFEIMVIQVSVVASVMNMAAADAQDVFASVDRKA